MNDDDLNPVDDFLRTYPGEGLTPEQYAALLLEDEAHRDNRRMQERAA